MNDLEKAARQALEALIRSKVMDDNHFYCYAAATALYQALEQAEKKPYNLSCAPGYCYCKEMTEQPKQKREWIGLTDEEIDDVVLNLPIHSTYLRIARVIEAKLKEKNT